MANPIADLSYRNYDGPLEPPIYRWWSIAKMQMRLGIKKRWVWFLAFLCAYWYIVLSTVFYFVETIAAQTPGANQLNASQQFFSRIVWKDQFLDAFSIGQLPLLLLVLLLGAGVIANDNRANALLVYLSKPCSKLDYLIGKWFGLFIPIFLVTLVPMLVFYLYSFLAYRQYGFTTQDPYLPVRLLAIAPLPAAFHASVLLGISSLFNQGRLAGAAYAGVYFMTLFLTKSMQVVRAVTVQQGGEVPSVVDFLYYMSIDGIQIGLAKAILGTRGSPLFGGGPRGNAEMLTPAPSLLFFGGLFVTICVLFLVLAWRRIRAVEVVG
jgi:ABC-2 type transport system permease protein